VYVGHFKINFVLEPLSSTSLQINSRSPNSTTVEMTDWNGTKKFYVIMVLDVIRARNLTIWLAQYG
jgi:hypothetical protein